MMSEHLFVIGAQRSGTTYFYHILNEHPQIAMAQPIRPEPKFFLRNDIASLTLQDYEQAYFADVPAGMLRGEKSTTYIESDTAPRLIREWFPDAKILVMLREPIARAVSNYHFSSNNGLETLPIEQAFFQEEERRDLYDKTKISASPYAYLLRGRYINYLRQWEVHFPREQIIINIFEEFVGSQPQIQALYEALGVDTDFVPERLEVAANSSEKVELPKFSPELKAYLRDYFAESNAALEAWLGRPIPAWAHPAP